MRAKIDAHAVFAVQQADRIGESQP